MATKSFLVKYRKAESAIIELIDALNEVNEADQAADKNEWSISDNNGSRIILAHSSNMQTLTVHRSKSPIKIVIDVKKDEKPKQNQRPTQGHY